MKAPARALRLATLAVVVLALVEGRAGPRRPTVVLVSVDGLRADHVAAYGYRRPTTPAIDRLARQGTIFTHAFTTSPSCLPATASLLTGTAALVHGVVRPGGRLGPALRTVAEAFRAAGYRTLGIFANPLVPPAAGLDRGFEGYANCRSGGRRRGAPALGPRPGPAGVYPCVMRELATYLSRVDTRPLFLFAELGTARSLLALGSRGRSGGTARSPRRGRRAVRGGERLRRVAVYDLGVRLADGAVGALLDLLGVRGFLDDALVAVTADHGEELGDHGGWGHGRTLYEEVVRVPLVLWGPGRIAGGRRLQALASVADLAPTLLDLAGLPPLPEATGRSLVPRLAGPDRGGRPVLSSLLAPGPPRHALHLNPWFKVISGPRFEYYLLDRDPAERDPNPWVSGYAVLGRRTLARAVAQMREKAERLRAAEP